jgi:hypothetical protein
METKNSDKKKTGLVTAGMVLGIIAIATSFIPIINNASIIMGILALVFGIVGFAKKTPAKAKAVTGVVLGALSLIIALSLQASWSNSLNELSNDLNKATGGSTEELLQNDVDVTFGAFVATQGDFTTDTKLDVTVKNKNSEQKSYSLKIEAVDGAGSRIDDDTVYVNDLGSGQSQTFQTFQFVSSDQVEALKSAIFKVYEVSQY